MGALTRIYFCVPIITFSVWITCIAGLLGLWSADGYPRYTTGNAAIVVISDVGAAHKAFFIVFACLTALLYLLNILLLRHTRRRSAQTTNRPAFYKLLNGFSDLFAVVGAVGLIFLSTFDHVSHPSFHWSMTFVFLTGVALSVFLHTLQVLFVRTESDSKSQARRLRLNAFLKCTILGVALCVLIAFVAMYATCHADGDSQRDRVLSAAGVCEWTMAFLLGLFFLTYAIDFLLFYNCASHDHMEEHHQVHDGESHPWTPIDRTDNNYQPELSALTSEVSSLYRQTA